MLPVAGAQDPAQPDPEPRTVVVLQNSGGAAVSKTYFFRSVPLIATLVVVAAGCQEAPDGVVGPLDASAHHAPGHSGGKGGGGGGGGDVIDLSGGFSTATSQPIEFGARGRNAGASSADDAPVTFVLDGLTTTFDAGSCEWTSDLDAASAEALWTEATGKYALSVARWFRMGVDLKANGQPDTRHGTLSRHREGNFNWELRVGVPGELLGSIPATGTFVDNGATQVMTITGGAVGFLKVDCGSNVGCDPTAPGSRVACPNVDAFVGTVTPG